jgi:hypothetical protein
VEFIDHLTGRAPAAWKVEDFALQKRRKRRDDDESEAKPDPGARNLGRLINQFVGYLRREEGVPYPRGELVRKELLSYFVRRHEGDLDPRPSMMEQALNPKLKLPPPPPPGHPLCPERVTLEVYLAGLMGMFNNLYHVMAAVFEIMPAWLRFLETCGLIDADRRVMTVKELVPLHTSLLKALEKWGGDPTINRTLQAWPADAAKGPAEARKARNDGAE